MKRSTRNSLFALVGVSAIGYAFFSSRSVIGPMNIVGRKITGKQLLIEFQAYEEFVIRLDQETGENTLRIFGVNAGVETEITKDFTPTTPHLVEEFNLRELRMLGNKRPSVMPNPSKEYFFVPARKRFLTVRHWTVQVNETDNVNASTLKTANPIPPGGIQIFGSMNLE